MEVIGIDLGGTFIKVGRVNENGKVLAKEELPTYGEKGKDVVLSQMEKGVRAVMGERIDGIGIGSPGVVDDDGNVFLAPNIVGWDNLPLRKIFEEKFRCAVKVENDVNTITWGEYKYGAGKGSKNMVCITLGTGLGGGVVIDGKLLRGRYSAAELGHITIDYKGPRCKCGNIGCVERFVGAEYIVEMARKEIESGRDTKISGLVGELTDITPKIISDAAKAGDELAIEIWKKVGLYIGSMLTSLVNIFNPEVIVIGGGIARAGEVLFSAIRETICDRAFSILTRDLKIVPPELGEETGIISAASLLLEK